MARTVWIVSRHPGAHALLETMGVVGLRCQHLNTDDVSPDDVVVGTLPVCLIAQLCDRGIEYWHLSLQLQASDRGQELSVERMIELDARIERFDVRSLTPPVTGRADVRD